MNLKAIITSVAAIALCTTAEARHRAHGHPPHGQPPGTNMSPPAGYTSGELKFEETFPGTSISSSIWNTFMTDLSAGGTPWYSDGGTGSAVSAVAPQTTSSTDNYFYPTEMTISNGLTLNLVNTPVVAQPAWGAGTGTYPYTGSAITSYSKFEFTGGYLQIRMKAASGAAYGNWLALWMLNGANSGANPADSTEIDIQEAGFFAPYANAYAGNYHGPDGTDYGTNQQVDIGVDLSQAYHIYAINWVPGVSITYYVDGVQRGDPITTAIPNAAMFLIIVNCLAGPLVDFRSPYTPGSTPASMSMSINDIQLYQHSGGGTACFGCTIHNH